MKRKIYEISFSEKEQPRLYQSLNGKWEKDCNNAKSVAFSLTTIKKNMMEGAFKKAIKRFNNFDMNGNLFLIKQDSKVKNEVKITIMLSPGFGDKLVGEIVK